MRTTVNIDDLLLAEAKVIAARTHRTIGSVLEDALRALIDEHNRRAEADLPARLPTYEPADPALRPGVDLHDKELMAEVLSDDRPPQSSRPQSSRPRSSRPRSG